MNNFLKGAATLLDIFATQRPKYRKRLPEWEDFNALRSDWEQVGKDLRSAIISDMEQLVKENYPDIKNSNKKQENQAIKLNILLEILNHYDR